jgi:hypothetical protein
MTQMPGGAMSFRGIKAMDQINSNREWNQKNGTLSEKTAFKEFGLTEDDIITAINAPPQIMMLGWGLISKDKIMQD